VHQIFDQVLPTRENLFPIAAAILVVYLLKGVAAYLSGYLMTDVGQRVVRDLRNLLFRHILGQSVAFFSLQTTGRLMSRITNDVGQVQRAVSETLGDLARESLSLVGFTALMFYYDARLALVCLTGAPIVVYPLVRLGQRVRRTARRSQEALEQMSHVSAEAITGHRIVKAFGTEAREAAKFERASQHFYRTSMKVTGALSVLHPMMAFIGGVAFVAPQLHAGQELVADRGSAGAFHATWIASSLPIARVNEGSAGGLSRSIRIGSLLTSSSRSMSGGTSVPTHTYESNAWVSGSQRFVSSSSGTGSTQN
jgi:subfamily B ATP-binding cassette protein MsbA